jgi:hypothetical protein
MIALPSIAEIPTDEIASTIETVAAFLAALAKRQRESSVTPVPTDSVDEMLDIRAAAQRLGVSVSWLYHRRDLNFRTKVGGKVLYSAAGIAKYLKARAGR